MVGVGYTGGGRGVGSAAGMTVHGALRLVKISHNVEEHAEWVHVVQMAHSPKRVIGKAEYVVCLLVKSTEVNL